MHAPTKTSLALFFLAPFFLLSCKGKDGDSATPSADSECDKPYADAGSSRALPLGSKVAIDGSNSSYCADHSQDTITYTWLFENIPSESGLNDSSFADNESSTATQIEFIPDVPGEYVVSLRLTDPDNTSEPAYVVTTVTSDDLSPTATCGGDQDGQQGIVSTLDGSDSSDPEGAELTYIWTVASVPECSKIRDFSLFDHETASPSIIPDCAGAFVVSLVVTDGLHESDPAFCTIDASSENSPPFAEAGAGDVIPSCAESSFQLNGWGSYDEDGDQITYQWTVHSTPEGAETYGFDDDTLPDPLFTWDLAGEWTFLLQVHDGTTLSAPDTVTYTVNGSGNNHAPSASAGADVTITTTAPCSRDESYAWTCGECEITTVDLDGSGSSDPDDDLLTFTWSSTDELLTFSSTETAITTAAFPPIVAAYGVTHSSSYEFRLDVEDCSDSDNDHITIVYQCTGYYDYGW